MISIDSKKKELIGNFSREGYTYTQTPVDDVATLNRTHNLN
ncbi:hypothetical protein [Nitrosomonas communis]